MYDKDNPTTVLIKNVFVLMIISLCHLHHNNIVSYTVHVDVCKIRHSSSEKGLGTNLVS